MCVRLLVCSTVIGTRTMNVGLDTVCVEYTTLPHPPARVTVSASPTAPTIKKFVDADWLRKWNCEKR